MIGQTFNQRYQVTKQLGKKIGRQTFVAIDLETQESVVLKLLAFGIGFEWEHLKLFEREAKTLKQLSHPAIPRYLDYFEVNLPTCQGFGLVQTYIQAPSLAEHIKEGRTFTEAELKQIAEALLSCLVYLHGQHPPVIHRDINPNNILLTNNRSGHSTGELFLVDFGSVQNCVAVEAGTITIVGTYGYMPPEQFGKGVVAASDLYALGATLIYLATGQNPADLPQKNLRTHFEAVTNFSPGFSYWLRRMIEPSLEQRFNSAHQALKSLQKPELIAGETSLKKKIHGSRVVITKNSEELQIIIPPSSGKSYSLNKNNSLSVSKKIINYMVFYLYHLSLLLGVVSFFCLCLTLFAGVFLIQFWTSGIVFLGSFIIFFRLGEFQEQRLVINKNQIISESIIANIPFDIISISLEGINKIEITYPGYSQQISTDFKQSKLDKIKQQLIIWQGIKEHKMPIFSNLSIVELEWLASELSDWLKIPLEGRQIPISVTVRDFPDQD